MCHRGGCFLPKYTQLPALRRTAPPSVPAECRTAKQQEGKKRRSQTGEYSEPNLSGGPLSRQHCLRWPLLLEGTVRGGTVDDQAGSQLVTVRDDHTKPKEGALMEPPARISTQMAGLES